MEKTNMNTTEITKPKWSYFAIDKCLELYDEASNSSLDWLIASWNQTDPEDKEICLAFYKKSISVRRKLAKRLEELTNG